MSQTARGVLIWVGIVFVVALIAYSVVATRGDTPSGPTPTSVYARCDGFTDSDAWGDCMDQVRQQKDHDEEQECDQIPQGCA